MKRPNDSKQNQIQEVII